MWIGLAVLLGFSTALLGFGLPIVMSNKALIGTPGKMLLVVLVLMLLATMFCLVMGVVRG